MWVPVLIPAAPRPFQLPACGLGKQLRMAQSLGTLHPHGDLDEAPGPWFQISSAPNIVAAWGVNHQMEDLPLCLSSSLYIRLSNKNKINLKIKSTRAQGLGPSSAAFPGYQGPGSQVEQSLGYNNSPSGWFIYMCVCACIYIHTHFYIMYLCTHIYIHIYIYNYFIFFLIMFTYLRGIYAHVDHQLWWGGLRHGKMDETTAFYPLFSSCIWGKWRQKGRGLLPTTSVPRNGGWPPDVIPASLIWCEACSENTVEVVLRVLRCSWFHFFKVGKILPGSIGWHSPP